MKKISFAAGIMTLCMPMLALAGSGIFYTQSGKFYAKGSGLCPSGNAVQAICQQTSTASAPAATPPFLGDGEALSHAPQACTIMGTDYSYEYYVGDGNHASVNHQSDQYLYGYMRAFSGTAITSSAYFGNSPIQPINPNDQPSSDNEITNNVIVNTVNPAYVIPMVMAPGTNGGNGLTVTGVVFATAAGQNNQLESGWLLVEWRLAGSTSWVEETTAIGAAGEFAFEPSVASLTSIYVRVRVKDGHTPRPGLPVSAEYLVSVVPEPSMLLALLALVGLRRNGGKGKGEARMGKSE